jgi:hypothetical protein
MTVLIPNKKRIALQKLAFVGDNPHLSCAKCLTAVPVKLCVEKEETHKALNLRTEKFEEHYKLSYYCPKCKDLIGGAVVFNHEVQQ